jgi:hypothetical protein
MCLYSVNIFKIFVLKMTFFIGKGMKALFLTVVLQEITALTMKKHWIMSVSSIFIFCFFLIPHTLRAQGPVLPLVNTSYSTLNNTTWGYKTSWPSGKSWDMDMYIYNYTGYTTSVIKKTSTQYGGLADYFGTYSFGVREWDYSFHYLNGLISGDGDTIVSGPYNGYSHVPINRADAYTMMRGWFLKKLIHDKQTFNPTGWLQSMSGHFLYQHYGARWGGNLVDEVGSEIGENIRNTNIHIAFTRGAARQYQKSWGIQFSPWYGSSILDYTTPNPIWAYDNTVYSDPNGGHSLELFKRSYYTLFMAGANVQHMEATSVNWFNGRTQDANGCLSLSPLGTIGKEFYDFAHAFSNGRGVPYAPIAIVLDTLHGVNQENTWDQDGNYSLKETIWKWFDPEPSDLMTSALFNVIFPHSFEYTTTEETGFSVNAPYGDVFDVLTEDASQQVLQSYPVIYLSGAVQPGSAMAGTLQTYVNGGGTLVINIAQLTPALSSSFTGLTIGTSLSRSVTGMVWLASKDTVRSTATMNITTLALASAKPLISTLNGEVLAAINTVGAGRVIVVAQPYSTDAALTGLIMKHLTAETVPFHIEGDVQYLVNRSDDGWLLTCINNKGVSKPFKAPSVIDAGKTASVQVSLAIGGKQITGVSELRSGTAIALNTLNGFVVQVLPGDVQVYKIKTSDVAIGACSATGSITREYWYGNGGMLISSIPVNDPPTSVSSLNTLDIKGDTSDNYGDRIRGYICAPATGSYTFWIAGDDAAELWLSANDGPADKVKIAYVSSWTNYREWNKFSSQQSVPIALQSGKKYYIEVLHKEASGGDHVSVGWQLPDGTYERPVPGMRLSPYIIINKLPTVSITSPINNTSFTAPANIALVASASDADGSVSNVQFYNGATLLGSDATTPYSFTWTNVTAGIYSITAQATDNSGAITTSSVVSIVVNPAPNVSPTVSVTGPANNASFIAPASIALVASASDADGSVSNVQFYNGATLLGSDATTPYSFTWTNVTAGTYSIAAKATDNSGAITTSSVVSIVVNPAPNVSPTVSITGPANNASFTAPASIALVASASDADGSVSNVQFYNGATLLGSDATTPYSFTWTNVTAGTYSITAKATDNSGAITTSSVINITVALSPITTSVTGVKALANCVCIYPNPFTMNTNIYVQSEVAESYMIIITDFYGRQIYTGIGYTNEPMYLTELLVDGMYLVRIQKGTEYYMTKVIRQ